MREKKKEEARARMVARMKEEYPRAFFRALMLMAECPVNNLAETCLKQWMQSLFCCFDSLEIQLFEGSLKACRQGKLLEAESYKMMERWCEDRWLQINQQNRARGAYIASFRDLRILPKERGRFFVTPMSWLCGDIMSRL